MKKKKKNFMQQIFSKISGKHTQTENTYTRIRSKNQQRDHIRLLPMSIYPNLVTLEYFGLVDVHLIRRIWLDFDSEIQEAISDLIMDLNEIVKTRVEALGGNCLIGYRIDINCLQQKPGEKEVYVIVTGTGDAVQLSDETTN